MESLEVYVCRECRAYALAWAEEIVHRQKCGARFDLSQIDRVTYEPVAAEPCDGASTP